MIAAERARQAFRPRAAVRVDLGGALNLVGAILKYFRLAFLLPLFVALLYGESVWPFLLPGVAAAASGWSLERVTEGKERIGPREGFFVVASTWFLTALFTSLPYLLSGAEQLASPLDAYFEAMSGITTTGASILTDVGELSRSLAMWRQFSQWLGGMGIIVLALAVLPASASAAVSSSRPSFRVPTSRSSRRRSASSRGGSGSSTSARRQPSPASSPCSAGAGSTRR